MNAVARSRTLLRKPQLLAIASNLATKKFEVVYAIGGGKPSISLDLFTNLCPEYVGNCVAAGLSASGLTIRDNKLVKVF